jgi:4-aminobutyrate aminotransferase-like enzyme
VQRVIARENLIERVRTRGARLQSEIRKALSGIEEVGDVRGRGYFIGIESYGFGRPEERRAFEILRGTSEGYFKPDNLMDLVFPGFAN